MKLFFILSFIIICFLLFLLFYHLYYLRLIRRLENMIDTAINGHFTENTFDESRLSALESRFAGYLAASETSFKNIAAEKDKIKTLISDISHQTKIPLSNILLYSELLAEQDLPAEALQYASALTAQAGKLNFLITSLVKLSRLETGILTLSPKQSAIFPMIEALRQQYIPAAEEKGLFLSVPNPLPETERTQLSAVFDEKWTQEALSNILDNAVKYTESGGITISIKPYELFLCIEIADTGIGIPEQEQPKIFSRFYRSETVSQKPGVGIGLFLAREIIAAEGGYIKVSSEPFKSSVFSVYLPK